MLALRAVAFDYGRVLTGPPDPVARAALLRITGLPVGQFDRLYWADRPAYDEGKFTGLEFWRRFNAAAGLSLPPAVIEELNSWDARMWATCDPVMLDWQLDLKQRGLLTAIVSNMGDSVLERVEREFDWLPRFDVLVWSYKIHSAKPDPAIYLRALSELGTRPDETFFLDDKPENVEAAAALGMKALVFSTVENLCADLTALKLDSELPLPRP
ncbi:MAG: HAD family phosphatase [Terracidiphilus sp.]